MADTSDRCVRCDPRHRLGASDLNADKVSTALMSPKGVHSKER